MPRCPGWHQCKAPNPLWLVLSSSHVSWTWSERCVVVHILSDVGTENTHTPARLEALFESSQSSQFLPSRIRGSRHLASDCVLNPSKHFRVEICSVALVECILEGVVLELLRLDEICVLLLSFLVHVIRDLALPHDVLQHRLVLELFLREDVSHWRAVLHRIQEKFRSSPCSSLWPVNGCSRICATQNLVRKQMRLQKFLEPTTKPKVIGGWPSL